MKLGTVISIVLFAVLGFAKPKSEAPSVFFVEPKDGATLPTKFKVKMGVKGYVVKPAGDETPNSGHHHIIVNHQTIAKGEAVPVSPQHIHYGKGQTETELELAPGKYTLTLQFADKNHLSYGPELSSSISVTVVEETKKK